MGQTLVAKDIGCQTSGLGSVAYFHLLCFALKQRKNN